MFPFNRCFANFTSFPAKQQQRKLGLTKRFIELESLVVDVTSPTAEETGTGAGVEEGHRKVTLDLSHAGVPSPFRGSSRELQLLNICLGGRRGRSYPNNLAVLGTSLDEDQENADEERADRDHLIVLELGYLRGRRGRRARETRTQHTIQLRT